MALRLINRHRHPLRIDLRGGAVLVLAPGQRSEALREELLYDNCHLPEWERAGWVVRVAARFAEISAPAKAAPAAAAPGPRVAQKSSGRRSMSAARKAKAAKAKKR